MQGLRENGSDIEEALQGLAQVCALIFVLVFGCGVLVYGTRGFVERDVLVDCFFLGGVDGGIVDQCLARVTHLQN